MAQSNAVFEAAVNDHTDTIRRAKERIAILRSNKSRIEKLFRPVNLILAGADMENKSHTYVSVRYDDTLHANVTMNRLDSFKAPALQAVLEYFSEMSKPDETRTSDWAASLNRDYHFTLNNEWTVTVCAYVKSDSPTCRKVAVGTEVEETIRYEIQCD
jgi:hypothetical protein